MQTLEQVLKKEMQQDRLYVSIPKEQHEQVVRQAKELGVVEIFNYVTDDGMLSCMSGQPECVALFLNHTGLTRKKDVDRFVHM